MISFLIPNYNYVCVDLVRDLARQGEQLRAEQPVAFDFEVVVADDASPRRETVEANRAINALPRCRYVERTQNVGRAHLCNWLIEEAKFDCIVIIDSDAAVCTPDFVRRYGKDYADIDRFWKPFCEYAGEDAAVINDYQYKVDAIKR